MPRLFKMGVLRRQTSDYPQAIQVLQQAIQSLSAKMFLIVADALTKLGRVSLTVRVHRGPRLF